MTNLIKVSKDHLDSVGESYLEHFVAAGLFSGRLLIASTVCLIHAFLPFLFVRTGSELLGVLHKEMVQKRGR